MPSSNQQIGRRHGGAGAVVDETELRLGSVRRRARSYTRPGVARTVLGTPRVAELRARGVSHRTHILGTEIAAETARQMWEADTASQALGMELVEVAPLPRGGEDGRECGDLDPEGKVDASEAVAVGAHDQA